jgi:hypothetical protein
MGLNMTTCWRRKTFFFWFELIACANNVAHRGSKNNRFFIVSMHMESIDIPSRVILHT